MWILPRLGSAPLKRKPAHQAQFPFTYHRITLAVYNRNAPGQKTRGLRWFAIRELPAIPVPSPHRRALDALLASKGAS
jgi:A/G-specific adenine glycosylase